MYGLSKKMLSQTSLKAYREINSDGVTGKQALKIYKLLSLYKEKDLGLTRNELSRLLYIPINAICGRVREMIKDGFVKESGIALDQFSHKENKIVKLKS